MRVLKTPALAVLVLFGLGLSAWAGEPIAIGERLAIASKVLGEERTILVSTPPGYAHGQARYPVLYLTDGDAHLTHTRGTVDFLARQGLMPQVIIVGIANTDRTRDLTPTRVVSTTFDGTTFQLPTSGGADKFIAFIETELVPYIQESYRTEPFRILCGHSFGALFGVYALLAKPDLFNAIIAASPTLSWDDGIVLKRARAFFSERRELRRTLFVTLGNEGRGGALRLRYPREDPQGQPGCRLSLGCDGARRRRPRFHRAPDPLPRPAEGLRGLADAGRSGDRKPFGYGGGRPQALCGPLRAAGLRGEAG